MRSWDRIPDDVQFTYKSEKLWKNVVVGWFNCWFVWWLLRYKNIYFGQFSNTCVLFLQCYHCWFTCQIINAGLCLKPVVIIFFTGSDKKRYHSWFKSQARTGCNSFSVVVSLAALVFIVHTHMYLLMQSEYMPSCVYVVVEKQVAVIIFP